MKSALFISTLSLFCLCSTAGPASAGGPETITSKKPVITSDSAKTTVTDGEFVFSAVDNEFSFESVRQQYQMVSKTPTASKRDDTKTDTLMVYGDKDNTFTYYCTAREKKLINATVRTVKTSIGQKIKVGAPAAVLMAKFKLSGIPSTLIVKDDATPAYLKFEIYQERISSIIFGED